MSRTRALSLGLLDRTHYWGRANMDAQTQELLVGSRCTLDGFAREVSQGRGIDLAGLAPLTRVCVQTQNTLYLLTLLSPGESQVLVEGGRFFSGGGSRAVLCGSSYGGTLLKMAWIGLGMRMELLNDGRRIVTSPVMSLDVLEDSALPGPF